MAAHCARGHRGVRVTQHGGHQAGFIRLGDSLQGLQVAGETPVLVGLFFEVGNAPAALPSGHPASLPCSKRTPARTTATRDSLPSSAKCKEQSADDQPLL